MDTRIVPRQADDAERCFLLCKAAEPLEWDYDRAFARFTQEHTARFDLRSDWIIEDRSGQPAALVSACIAPEQPASAELDCLVHPGFLYDLGPRLAQGYDMAMEWALDQGATRFTAWSSDRTPWRTEFYAERGYRVGDTESLSVLDLTAWDAGAFAEKARRAGEAGVEIFSAAHPDAPARHEVPDLVNRACESMPSLTEWADERSERILDRTFEAPYSDPELILWARVDGQWAGLSMVLPWSPESAIQDATAVYSEFRCRGIAWALKLRVTRAAQQRGIKRLVTWNDVGNAGMLAVNRQMGYAHRMHVTQMLLGHEPTSE